MSQASFLPLLSGEHLEARAAADALRAVLEKRVPKPALKCVGHVDGRKTYSWHYSYPTLPGLSRTTTGQRRGDKIETTYEHKLLPGWCYLGRELGEMLEDLENVARGLGQPTKATRK